MRVYHDFLLVPIQINVSWCGSESGQMIRIRNTAKDQIRLITYCQTIIMQGRAGPKIDFWPIRII